MLSTATIYSGGKKMCQIDARGMQVAELTAEQLQTLQTAEQSINAGASKEIYLLAVSRS